jgi:hypothetical protein
VAITTYGFVGAGTWIPSDLAVAADIEGNGGASNHDTYLAHPLQPTGIQLVNISLPNNKGRKVSMVSSYVVGTSKSRIPMLFVRPAAPDQSAKFSPYQSAKFSPYNLVWPSNVVSQVSSILSSC